MKDKLSYYLLRTDVTLHDLVELLNQGYSVVRSPHVGNLYPMNLVLAQAKIPLNLYDRMIVTKDSLYHPGKLIQGGRVVQKLGEQKVLVGTQPDIVSLHLEALKNVYPNTTIRTQSQFEQSWSGDIVEKALESISSIFETFGWTRKVLSGGKVVKETPKSWRSICQYGIYGLDSTEIGWIIPLAIGDALELVCQACQTGKSETYHLASWHMTKYFPSQVGPDFNRAVTLMTSRLDMDHVYLNLVPAAGWQFAVPKGKEVQLEQVFRILDERAVFKEKCKVAFQNQQPVLGSTYKWANAGNRMLNNNLRHALANCIELIYQPRSGCYFTQHDLVTGKELFVHPRTYSMTAQDSTEQVRLLRRFAKRGKLIL